MRWLVDRTGQVRLDLHEVRERVVAKNGRTVNQSRWKRAVALSRTWRLTRTRNQRQEEYKRLYRLELVALCWLCRTVHVDCVDLYTLAVWICKCCFSPGSYVQWNLRQPHVGHCFNRFNIKGYIDCLYRVDCMPLVGGEGHLCCSEEYRGSSWVRCNMATPGPCERNANLST